LRTPDAVKNQTTRVFRAGNSLAVRIPKAFEIPEGEVVIEQRDGGLFINTRRGKWVEFFQSLERIDWPELDNVRPQDLPRSVDTSWVA
jgi:virulence-associated protein VagC